MIGRETHFLDDLLVIHDTYFYFYFIFHLFSIVVSHMLESKYICWFLVFALPPYVHVLLYLLEATEWFLKHC
jgi:hypothetical protein